MNKKDKQFIIDVVPLAKIPLTTHQSFSYLSDEKLTNGTLVSVPLFRRSVRGVVVDSRDDFSRLGNIELKKIEKVLEENFLTRSQLKLARFISDHYFSPLGVVMKNFTPQKTKSRKKKTDTKVAVPDKKIILTKEQKKAVSKITSPLSSQSSRFLLFGPSGCGKTEVYIHSILELAKKDKNFQFLVLLPEKTLSPQAAARYGAHFESEEIVFLSSNLSKGEFFANWQKIRNGEVKIIIGTRMAVFAPFKKLGLIVIDEEQDASYKQWEMNPRYDARTVAEKISTLHRCPLIRGSATPLVESYWRAKNNDLKLITLSHLKINKLPIADCSFSAIEIVDMRREKWKKQFRSQSKTPTCLSKKLKSEIEYALKNKLQSIIFINRQGMSSFSVCDSCKAVLKCPKCDRALIYEKRGYYKCIHCNHLSDLFPKCEKCGHIEFRNVGLGTQKVEKEIANVFSSAKIIVADSSSSKVKYFHEKIYAEFSSGRADILIGTQMITKGWDLPNVALIGIIDTDNMLSFPDFNTEEKAFNLIVQVSGRANRPGAKFPGRVVLQTFQPENRLIKLAAEKNYAGFFENEIAERKYLKFPPFSKIIKLIYQDFDLKRTESECDSVFDKLNSIEGIRVSEPHNPLLSKVRGKFRQQIVVKSTDKVTSPALEKELRSLNHGWIIDVDPVSLL
jgi:primosomal protein N' (replication factor Y) (superfamily II helicase)